ncbi:Polyketide_cyc domain-containing protein [Psidium guajava]|nr:Polyketide_cyc domain-containing protein [Psidium guajava]
MLSLASLESNHSLHQIHSSAIPCLSLSPTSSSRFALPISSNNSQNFLFTATKSIDPRFDRLPFCARIDYSPDEGLDEGESVSGESGDEVFIEIKKTGNNSRRIVSRIGIDATLDTIWSILTDYERLSDFCPGLAVSELMEKRENFARLYQIGQQNLAFGLKFNAKGVVDCYEKDLECLPSGQKRDIEFKMIEGDFQIFEGKWSIEQLNNAEGYEDSSLTNGQEFQTRLSYMVDVKPKLWLPVGLVEGRLSNEITMNLSCIREEARKVNSKSLIAPMGQEDFL